MPGPTCRFCHASLHHIFVDLGVTPLCESYVSAERYNEAEPFYPLRAYVCDACFLVQIEALVSPAAIFTEYAYFSSYADTWVQHAQRYTEMAIDRFGLDSRSFVVEVGSNDGYLLQHFVARTIPVLGIDPAANVAAASRERNVPTLVKFFGEATARELVSGATFAPREPPRERSRSHLIDEEFSVRPEEPPSLGGVSKGAVAVEEGRQADLIVANNVLAQVPDLHDFVTGIKLLLKPNGVATIEFPHLLRLMEQHQFDTVYHEHFSYFSLATAVRIFAHHGLRCFDVEVLPTHGGSLRLYLCHDGDATKATYRTVTDLEASERAAGLDRLESYARFGECVKETKRLILDFLIGAKRRGKSVAAYGAPGKGNTLLNYCGVRTDFIDYTVDRNPYKQGKYLPGTRIPIYHPDRIATTKPDYLFILPWNFKDEIMSQMAYIRDWGARFVVPIPTVTVYP